MIRLKIGPYLVGHFHDVSSLLAAAAGNGIDVADLQIKE